MSRRQKVIFLKAEKPYSASFYYSQGLSRGLNRLDIDLVEIPFSPYEQQPKRDLPSADLLLIVDCGLPVEFPGLEDYRSPKGFVSIDSCHKLDLHKAYQQKYRFDLIWVAQKHMVPEFGPGAMWLPLAADEEIHTYQPYFAKSEGTWARIRYRSHYDIGMCAAPYKHRRSFAELFKKAGLSTNFYFRKRFGEVVTRELGRCTIGFNVGAGFTGQKGQDINMRIFETMANGLCMLLTNTYENLGYEDLFEEGRHYVGYRTEQEALDKALYYAKHTSASAKIAREGQKHILANHTYTHRCMKILESIS